MRMKKVEIYTTRYCPYCIAAKRLLSTKGVEFTEFDVSGNADARRRMSERAHGRITVPQIFIGSVHVGGYDDLSMLDLVGNLDGLLAERDASAGSEPSHE
jgi:glutaredoxin 3